MALERSVLMNDGIVRRHHVVTNIQHVIDMYTLVEVVSTQYENGGDTIGCHTTLTHAFDDTLTFAKAYEWIEDLPEFSEIEDNSGEEILRLQGALDDLTSQNEELAAQKDELVVQKEELAAQKEEADANLLETVLSLHSVLNVLTDDQALNFATMYPEWKADQSYTVDYRVLYDDKLYRCVQAHTSQVGWEPTATPALWVKVSFPNTIDEWVQPTGAHDAYQKGDKVLYNGSTWESTADSNVWAPGVYGWVEVE